MDIANEIYRTIEPYLNSSPTNLYHYTNKADIIFNSGFLKLSSHQKLIENNHSELSVGSNLILRKLLSDPELIKHSARFWDYKERGITIYILSCCLDEISTHHSKYGNSHIRLPESFLRIQKEYYAKLGIPLLIGKVIYEEESQIKLIDNILKSYHRSHLNSQDQLINLMTCLTLILPLFKPIRDKYDKEYRIISYQIFSPNGWKYFPVGVEKIFFNPDQIFRSS